MASCSNFIACFLSVFIRSSAERDVLYYILSGKKTSQISVLSSIRLDNICELSRQFVG